MKYLSKKQISGFSSKPKAEKKLLRKLARRTSAHSVAIFILVFGYIFLISPLIKTLENKLYGSEILWVELCVALLIGWTAQFIISGFILNPGIERIIKEMETEPIN